MENFQKSFDRVVTYVEKAVFYFSAALLVLVSAIVCVEIVSRNVFGYSFVFVEEITMIMLSWVAFSSAAYTMRKRGHVAVDFVYGKFNMPVRRTLYALTYVGGIVFMIYIVIASQSISEMQMKIPLTLSRLPRGIISLGLPVGASVIVFFMITDLIETFVFKRERSLMTAQETTSEAIEKDMKEYEEIVSDLLAEQDAEASGAKRE